MEEANGKQQKSEKKEQLFVKEGTKMSTKARWEAKANAKIQESILGLATDWKYNFDLPEYHDGKYNNPVFPHEVTPTMQRIDGYIISRKEKLCVLGPEMTSPMDDNVMKWHAKKTEKYRKMVAKVEGWRFFDLAVEVGALGWIPPSTHGKLKELGFTSKETKMIKDELTFVARMCSYVIFINRNNKDFRPYRVQTMSKGPFLNRNFDKLPDSVVFLNRNFDKIPDTLVQVQAKDRAHILRGVSKSGKNAQDQTKAHTRKVKGVEERTRNNTKSLVLMCRASRLKRVEKSGKTPPRIQMKPGSCKNLSRLQRLKQIQTFYTEMLRGERK